MRWLVVGVGAAARGVCLAPRPPPPFQVPSASRRGGLKTPGGVARPPWGRGGRARGESGGASRLPQTPPSPCVGPGWRVAWRATVTAAAAAGRGLPGGRCAGRGRVRCVRAPLASLGEGGNPRAPVGCPSLPWRAGAGWPRCVKPFPDPSGLLFFCLTWPARGSSPPPGSPPPQLPSPGEGRGGGGGECAVPGAGSPAETKHLKKTSYDS